MSLPTLEAEHLTFKCFMKTIRIALFALSLVLAGCVPPPVHVLTPLEIQSLQSREYEQHKDIVFPSVISVFQDLGYIIRSADKDTGLITAESAANSDPNSMIWGVTDVTQTTATAFIERIGKMTKVRLNFVVSSKKSFSYGQSDRQDTPIMDAKTYQNAFERIENAVFIRSAN